MGPKDIYSAVYDLANTMHIIELEIKPGDTLAAEASIKYWFEEGITFDLRNHVIARKGFILMRLRGHGRIFVHTGGRVTKKLLKNEVLRIAKCCIVGFTSGIRCDAKSSGIFRSPQPVLNGSHETTLKGTGTVYLQSKPHIRQQRSN